jgi:hypothetical protein
MTSAIIKTNPTAGTATTSSVRDNFSFASDEITALQRTNVDIEATTGGPISYLLNYGSPSIPIVDGTRVSARINAANTTTGPVLTVSPQNTPQGIRKADGSILAIGDLAAGGIYDFIWSNSLSQWFCLNLSTSNEATLLETVLGGIYPVGSLLTTTVATDPGDADYFFSGVTFGTWEAYAQGRTIVGIDTGTVINSAISASNVITLSVTNHPLAAGDTVIVSGFSDSDANGEFLVSSTTATTIVYTAANVSDGPITGTDLLVKNKIFDATQEIGGATHHKLLIGETPVNSTTLFASGSGQSFDRLVSSSSNSPHSVQNPYIVTYIWKRTA